MAPPVKVLIADDDDLVRRSLRRSLGEDGYRVVEAMDGHEAWQVLQADDVDVALLDVSMPGLDGVALTRRLRERPPDAYLPVILVTGSAEPADVERGLEAGADDFVAKPFDPTELRARIRNVLRIRGMEEALRRSHLELRRHLEAAGDLQRAFLPRSPLVVPRARFAWVCEPSHVVAGDMLGVQDLGARGLAFYVADISGHGAPAAMLSIWVDREIQRDWRTPSPGSSDDPALVCAALDRRFGDARSTRYVACLLAVVHPESGLVRYCRCGLPYPAVLRRDGRSELLKGGGHPPLGLGLFAAAAAEEVVLQPGDRMFAFSDGLLDALAVDGGDGERELALLLDRTSRRALDDQVAELARAVGRGPHDVVDDVTVLGLELLEGRDG